MKRSLIICSLLLLCQSAMAQFHYQDGGNPDMLRPSAVKKMSRKEIIIPDVAGYKVYKADFHTHTIYSDGHCLPEVRVREAWQDGLDILSITDHFEIRKYANDMLGFLRGHVPEGEKHERGEVSDKIDYNIPYESAKSSANRYGVLLVPGIEISRDVSKYGHFNALFTTDNNLINDQNPETAIRNARAQGAVIMHNHPGWRRPNLDTHEFEDKIYSEGLIDGIEIMNNNEFYPRAIERAQKLGFFMSSNSDIHGTIAEVYQDQIRNFTMVLAEECTSEAVREALLARRTLAYSYGTVAGEESLLKALFEACVKVELLRQNDTGSQVVRLVNHSSIPFVLTTKGGRQSQLAPSGSQNYTVRAGGLNLTIENLWCGADKHPVVTLLPIEK